MSTSIAHVWGVSGMHTGDCWVTGPRSARASPTT